VLFDIVSISVSNADFDGVTGDVRVRWGRALLGGWIRTIASKDAVESDEKERIVSF